MSGDVFAVDANTILIRKFTYDGDGTDTFFWAGTSNRLENLVVNFNSLCYESLR